MPKIRNTQPIYDNTHKSYRLHFCYQGKQYKGPYVKNRAEAYLKQGRINQALVELKFGTKRPSPGESVRDFIFHCIETTPRVPAPETAAGEPEVTHLSQLIEEYKDNRPRKAEGTIKNEEGHIRHLQKFLKKQGLGDPLLSSITVKFFDQYKKYRYSQKIRPGSTKQVSPNTVKKELTTFQCIFQIGVKYGYLSHNVVRDVERDKCTTMNSSFLTVTERERLLKTASRKEDKNWRCFLAPEEVPEYLSLAEGKWYYPILVTMAYTGARRGEIIALEWADVNLEKGFLLVYSKKQSRKKIISRQIEIHNDLMPMLLKQRQKTGQTPWVFNGPRGGKVSPHSLSNAVNRMNKGTKFEGIATHVFRHSLITNLVLAKENSYAIREITGHTNQEMQDLYTHITSEQRRATINKLQYNIKIQESANG